MGGAGGPEDEPRVPCADIHPVTCRHAYLGHAAAGHPAHAGKRAPAVLLRLLHLRHRGRAALGWPAAQPLLPGQ